MSETPGRTLRAALQTGELLLAPGCHDPLSARLVEDAGFSAAYLGGFATAASLGYPAPVLDLTEQAQAAARVARVLHIPLVTDGDAGWGGPAQVRRTVAELEAAGVAGFHIEDHPVPKLLGYYRGEVEIVPRQELLMKLRTALAGRQHPETVIIGRTDAYAAAGGSPAEARWRAEAMLDLGADLVFIGGAVGEQDLRRVRQDLPEAPLMTINHGDLPLSVYRELRFRLVVYPTASLVVAHRAVREALDHLRSAGLPGFSPAEYREERIRLRRTLRIDELEELERSGPG